jgi:hypothetical protein
MGLLAFAGDCDFLSETFEILGDDSSFKLLIISGKDEAEESFDNLGDSPGLR